jgi:protoheme IX farnesyltransferase
VSLAALGAAVSGTALCSFSANTFNQIIERDSDALMRRTMMRPLPTRRVSIPQAMVYGVMSGVVGTGLLYLGTNPLTALLGLGNIVAYAGIYTPMKKVTPWNTAVGAVVGALPPVMGWAAATGSIVAPEALFLFLFQFLWQIPHFLALAYKYRKDYTIGGYKMLAVDSVDPSGKLCADISLYSALAMIPLPFYTSSIDMTFWMFAVDATVVNSWLLYESWKFREETNQKNANRLFKCSLVSLSLFLALFVYHKKKAYQRKDDESVFDLNLGGLHQVASSLCPHEFMASEENVQMCPKVTGNIVKEQGIATVLTNL